MFNLTRESQLAAWCRLENIPAEDCCLRLVALPVVWGRLEWVEWLEWQCEDVTGYGVAGGWAGVRLSEATDWTNPFRQWDQWVLPPSTTEIYHTSGQFSIITYITNDKLQCNYNISNGPGKGWGDFTTKTTLAAHTLLYLDQMRLWMVVTNWPGIVLL